MDYAKRLVVLLCYCGLSLLSTAAHAVICSVTATSVPLSTLYVSGSNTQYTGTISGSCAKEALDVTQPYIYIGLNQGEPPAGRSMTRQDGTQTLTYEIYHRTFGSGIWTEGTGVASTSGTNGGVFYRMSNLGVGVAQPFSFAYYLRIPSGQTTAPAGIYDDLAVTATVRLSTVLGTSTGTVLTSTSFGVSASIQHSCYFSTAPAPLVLNYTSFTVTPVTASAGFSLSCTYNSPYTLAIGPSTGTLLGLNYSLALSASSGTGTASPQNYSVNGSVAANQSGTCGTSSCTANQVHTITVTF